MSEFSFCYGQPRLENDLVSLEPFHVRPAHYRSDRKVVTNCIQPEHHIAKFMEQKRAHRELFQYVLFPDISTDEEFFQKVYEEHIAAVPGECLYTIIDKTYTQESPGEGQKQDQEQDPSANYAGTIALTGTNTDNASTEIGIVIFPSFQRTHVASNAIGLLLCYTLDPPSLGGLGLRRIEWKCHTANEASKKVALRMGFTLEGVLRWDRAFPGPLGLSVDALEKRNGTAGEVRGRHTAVFSIVWDEWEEKRAAVLKQMERRK